MLWVPPVCCPLWIRLVLGSSSAGARDPGYRALLTVAAALALFSRDSAEKY